MANRNIGMALFLVWLVLLTCLGLYLKDRHNQRHQIKFGSCYIMTDNAEVCP